MAAAGKNCPERRFVGGTLRMAELRVNDERECALRSADCTVTGGRNKVCALAVPLLLDTPMMFSMLNEGRLEGSDLIMDAVLTAAAAAAAAALRPFSCNWRLGLSCELNAFRFTSADGRRGTVGGSTGPTGGMYGYCSAAG